MKTKINKAYVISLKSREHRWSLFKQLNDKRIELFTAIDTRHDPVAVAEKYQFKIDPPRGMYSDYFSESKGGIGCYLSHYTIWQDIVKNETPITLVVEDDAEVTDIKKVLNMNNERYKSFLGIQMARPFHLIQLNRRTTSRKRGNIKSKYISGEKTVDLNFTGTESYLLSLEGAKRLIWLANNSEVFHDKILYPACKNVHRFEHGTHIQFKDTRTGRCIWSPVDNFMGRCSDKAIDNKRRINIIVKPRVSLHDNRIKSDIMTETKPHWHLSRAGLMKRRKREPYGWWGRGPDKISKTKIFEIGVKKTGTSSLGVAYKLLGLHDAKWNGKLYDRWIESGETDYEILFNRIDQYEAFQDGPWHDCDYKMLDKRYPGSKFIILERDDESWLKSIELHESPAYNVNNIKNKYLYDEWIIDRMETRRKKLKWKKNKYAGIKKYFKDRPSDLLIMNITAGDGWDKLCPFLGLDVPQESPGVPFLFPTANVSKLTK